MSGDWSATPERSGDGVLRDGVGSSREARGASPRSAGGPTPARVHGTPAPEYGEYAPDGWVNPVLVEQERRQAADEARSRREQAAREAAEAAARRRRPSRGPSPDTEGGAAPGPVTLRSRYGASPFDCTMTVVLLALGLWSAIGTLDVGATASRLRQVIEQQYTPLADPSALTGVSVVTAVVTVVLFALTAWWSIVRLRQRRWTFWVPLVGGAVASLVTAVLFLVAVMNDPAFSTWMMQRVGG